MELVQRTTFIDGGRLNFLINTETSVPKKWLIRFFKHNLTLARYEYLILSEFQLINRIGFLFNIQ